MNLTNSSFGAANRPSAEAPQRLRVVAANLTSGDHRSYDHGHGLRILRALAPDIVLIQEWNYRDNSALALAEFGEHLYGEEGGFYYHRDAVSSPKALPNGIISRFPLLEGGQWQDPTTRDRASVWGRIAAPWGRPLLLVSLHLSTRSRLRRLAAEALAEQLWDHLAQRQEQLSEVDLLIGGDFNTSSLQDHAFAPLDTFIVRDQGQQPADEKGCIHTNRQRDKPFDGLYANSPLAQRHLGVWLRGHYYPSGAVFDTRLQGERAAQLGVLEEDSAAPQMQHMAVVRDFATD